MQEMDIVAFYPEPNLNRRAKQLRLYPYLLRYLEINRPNQVVFNEVMNYDAIDGNEQGIQSGVTEIAERKDGGLKYLCRLELVIYGLRKKTYLMILIH